MGFLLDPDAVLDFEFDWSAWLATGETITAANVTADGNVTVESTSHTATTVTAWVSGGADRTEARLTCHVSTDGGREDDRGLTLRIRQR